MSAPWPRVAAFWVARATSAPVKKAAVIAKIFPLSDQGGAVECHLRWDSAVTATTCP